ncbi:MAG: hypothetical protein GKS00_07380 [Alphaproteobacteria bacterium]|nr:hypothetical protein [Alphaproteobacteria bacterium]
MPLKFSASIRRTGAGTKISSSQEDARARTAYRGLVCFAAGIVCFVLGATLVTARIALPEFTIAAGKVIFLIWPSLTIAAAILRYKGCGPRDWVLWTSISVLVIPAALVAIVFL